MKIQIWELRLYYNLFDVLFGKYQTIEEIYIPKLNHSFNFYEEDVNVLKTDKISNIIKPQYKLLYNWIDCRFHLILQF
jgi:hypothetical protein